MTTLDTELATTWIRRWDAQQEFYVADREERFAVIGDVVAATITTGTVVDLGCGPGSLAGGIAERLPDARIIGVDADPLLLALARGRYGNVEFVDADLAGTAWLAEIPAVVDAAVSTTALHWLTPAQLADVYRALADRIRPGGVFVNGDHLGLGDPNLDQVAAAVRQGRAARVGVTENEEWAAWWAAVEAEPALAGLLTERARRSVAHHGNHLSVAEHRDLLLAAGFRGASPVWQTGDDHVLVAIR
ncbi:MAG TPA: class I SAM-dependent methyltransferase [Pseudonocardiaceae bacterium]